MLNGKPLARYHDKSPEVKDEKWQAFVENNQLCANTSLAPTSLTFNTVCLINRWGTNFEPLNETFKTYLAPSIKIFEFRPVFGQPSPVTCKASGLPNLSIKLQDLHGKTLAESTETIKHSITSSDLNPIKLTCTASIDPAAHEPVSESKTFPVGQVPAFVDIPQAVSVKLNENTSFILNAIGFPKPELICMPENFTTIHNLDTSDGYRYSISVLVTKDRDHITCSLNNEYGSVKKDIYLSTAPTDLHLFNTTEPYPNYHKLLFSAISGYPIKNITLNIAKSNRLNPRTPAEPKDSKKIIIDMNNKTKDFSVHEEEKEPKTLIAVHVADLAPATNYDVEFEICNARNCTEEMMKEAFKTSVGGISITKEELELSPIFPAALVSGSMQLHPNIPIMAFFILLPWL
ncbi:hypothetical protein Ciccas_005694 [Cichlidogyrus casuarinus]|uniref:Uncharacterized protein n=1 Tax=Cichlidogyrus casuarinus TaxID=1844966 RepID=A0ABD2Q8E7_9PLAT